MKKVKWETAQNIYKNPDANNDVFFIFFTLENDLNSLLMKSVIKEVEHHFIHNSNVLFLEIDAIEAELYREPNTKFQVLEVPTFAIIKNNNIYNIGHNFYPKEIIIDWLDDIIN
ncbi:hypothetical protein [Mycoplasmopsis primatum]|uniref:hypothetical protein n=1 Tax=Mycoplasmopsis primatum TaxID=55604 RepID=UPI0004985831|nr:hypothetical protein [Mycoplasmopsis primatum]